MNFSMRYHPVLKKWGKAFSQIGRVMKMVIFIICASVLQTIAATTLAQKVTLSEKDASLKKVFTDLKKQTNYIFLYEDNTLNNTQNISFSVNNAELKDVLNLCVTGQPLDYTIAGNIVAIKRKEQKTTNQPTATLTPTTTVTGKVVNELGEPLPGVNIKYKTGNGGVATDINGKFTITTPDNSTVLVFSSVGYESLELRAGDITTNATITLKATNTGLSEVQILDKGYYFEKRELTTGSVSVVDSKTINEQPVFDPLQALEGRVAGLNIQQQSGNAGAYSMIRRRGVNSIANGTAPLYVIDGVPFSSQSLSAVYIGSALGPGNVGSPTQAGNGVVSQTGSGQSPFSAMNLGDIEEIEVLKDADATAIYGSRGANGVILITTKKGKIGQTKVNFDLNQGIGQVGHFMDLLNTQQFVQLRNQYYVNSNQPLPNINTDPTDPFYEINGVYDTTRYTNWQKLLIGNTAHYTKAQISVTGGNNNTQFLISGNYNRQTSVFPGNFEDKTASGFLSLTNTSDNKKFRLQVTASFTHDDNLLPTNDFAHDITMSPDAPSIYNANGEINWQIFAGTATFQNPFASLLSTSTAISNNLITHLDLSYELLPGLSLKSSFGYNHNEMNQTYISPSTAISPPYNTIPDYRTGDFGNSMIDTWNIEPQISYRKKIAKGSFEFLLGGTLQQNIQKNTTISTYGYSADALIIDPAAAPSGDIQLDNTYVQYRYNSVYSRIGYNWDEKYLFNITARRDGSTSFGPSKQYGNFGAIGGGWIFSKENFAKDLHWLNFGKLRASYGSTGNDQLQPYQYLSTYTINNTSYQGNIGLSPTSLTNPYFAWEVVKKLGGGVDLAFLKDRISLSIDYYRNRTSNQLVGYPLSTVTGFSNVQYNLPAVIQNTGLEVQISTTNIQSQKFKWTTSFNFTLPNNKLISYPGLAGSTYKNIFVVGQSIFIRKLFQYNGADPLTGAYSFATSNLSGVPTSPQDQVTTQPVTQKYYGGLQNNFTFKNFGLDIFIQYTKQLSSGYYSSFDAPASDYENQPTDVLKNPSRGLVANLNNANSYYTFLNSNGTITDGSFVRLKNVALSYRLPVEWQRWARMSNARIYVQGQNLYTFTKYIGLDPETQGLVVPPLRVIMAGVSASF